MSLPKIISVADFIPPPRTYHYSFASHNVLSDQHKHYFDENNGSLNMKSSISSSIASVSVRFPAILETFPQAYQSNVSALQEADQTAVDHLSKQQANYKVVSNRKLLSSDRDYDLLCYSSRFK